MGICVVCDVGLTAESVGVKGYKLEGGRREAGEELIKDGQGVEGGGGMMVVFEAMGSDVGKVIRETVRIGVIGIGAGRDTDGEVL
ncbi:3-methyl-2-oxobutanoate hydroxymethyltransferase, partial [Staphylococcus pettenkoferi]|uniref:3-methyl-2-oxobutanoate hydroxymethyltransferase n=1 Tax=Staphylococcus pettenkoferi TaxID=170573 RepID=UPI0021B6CD7C